MPPDALLTGLDEYQHAAVTSPAAPLAIVAPAGSGKTRVLTRRIAWRAREGTLDGRHVLAVTFTRKAADELTLRLRRLGVDSRVTAGTFHALALAQLRRRSEDAGREPPRVLDRKARILGKVMRSGGRAGEKSGGRAGEKSGGTTGPAAISEIASEIEWAKARMITPEHFAAAATASQRRLPRSATELADLYDRYEREKRRRRVLDFDDLLWWTAHAIETDEVFAAAQRWRFRHLFVDEFQDASPLAVRLVAAWLGERNDLCVVGDVSQAIYGFAGADASFLEDFDRHFPGGEHLELHFNYRSTPQVVRAAAAVLGRDHGTRAVRADGPVPRLVEHTDERAEARGVAQDLRDAHQHGVSWRDMAVLFRTNAQSVLFERAFEDARVPFVVAPRGRFLDRPEVQVLLERLQKAEQAAPNRPLADHLADLEVWADDDVPNDEQRGAAAMLAGLGRDYLGGDGAGRSTLAAFLTWAELTTRAEPPAGTADRVALLTFHRAKGLEWSLVCVTGLEDGFVPISYADTDAARAEERRLLHVALSRAHDRLHLSYARRRSFGERVSTREPSPWLDAPIAASVPGPADRVPDPRDALDAVRRTLATARPPQERPHVARRSSR